MSISDLLPELLLYIFRYSISAIDGKNYNAKYGLPILLVCRLWRSTCLPLIYQNVRIEFRPGNTRGIYSGSRRNTGEWRANAPQMGAKLDSDLALIPTMCIGLPRILTIDISYRDHPIECLHAIIATMDKHKHKLQRVNKLKINALLVSIDAIHHPNTLVDIFAECEMLATHLARNVPNISNFVFTNLIEEPVFKVFIQCVAKQYSHQLTAAEFETSSFSLVPSLPESITTLNAICMLDMHLPNVHTNNLRSLKLTGLGNTFNWSALEDKHMPGHINLPNLEHLYLGTGFTFAEVYEDNVVDSELGYGAWVGLTDNFPFRVYAPKLQILQMQVCPCLCSLLLSLDCPAVLQKLELIFVESITVCLRNAQVNSTMRAIFRKYANVKDGTINSIDFMNDLLQTPDMAHHTTAHIIRNLSIATMERTRWHYLDELVLESQVYSSVFDIIRYIPSLRKLKAKHLIPYPFDMFAPSAEAVSDRMPSTVDKLESNLECVDFSFNPTASKEVCDRVGAFIEESIPSLKHKRIR